MRPLRFLFLFFSGYTVNVLVAFTSIAFAQFTGNQSIIFAGLSFSFIVMFLFSWLYFRKISNASWRARLEAIFVWLGLLLIMDFISLSVLYNASISDLSMLSVYIFGINALILFISAYITASHVPRFSTKSPNLMESETEKTEQA